MNNGKVIDGIKDSYKGIKGEKVNIKDLGSQCSILMSKYSDCMESYSKKSMRSKAKLNECNQYFQSYNICMKQSLADQFTDEDQKKKLDVTKIQSGKSPNSGLLKEMEEDQKKAQANFDKKYKK